MNIEVPIFNTDFLCIANMDEMVLTAVASSYISKENGYLPVFEFPHVTDIDALTDENKLDPHHLSRTRAQAFNIQVHNCMKRLRKCENIILLGLTNEQKSYLTFLGNYNVIELDSIQAVEAFLGPFTEKTKYFPCRLEDVLEGLYYAVKNDFLLQIDDAAPSIVKGDKKQNGLVVLEKIDRVASIIAVNYALCSDCNIEVIQTSELNHREITYLIEGWQEGNQNSYSDLSAALYKGVEYIDFSEYKYAVFFTNGAPYSLVLNNIIPFCHVHYRLSIDFFVFNAIHFERQEEIFSAIVFSPEEFEDEETMHIVEKIEENNYYVRKLIGDTATAANLDNHVQHYPYGLLHICSHGGEVEGAYITEEFTDQDGNTHIVEYDEVVSFAPEEGEKKIKVTTKMIWRKFDGLPWRGKELKAKNYPHYVYSDMLNALKQERKKDRTRRRKIPNSCAIKCSDFNYQAMFNHIAAGQSPIVFNNTCWSWSDIADSFIAVGSRAYIGTLWEVKNEIATKVAKRFYDRIFTTSILDALQYATEITKGSDNEDIYILWGLPFTSLIPGVSSHQSKKMVLSKLISSSERWVEKFESTEKDNMKDNILYILRWIKRQINKHFRTEFIEMLSEGIIKIRK
jgi:hypothetical protein